MEIWEERYNDEKYGLETPVSFRHFSRLLMKNDRNLRKFAEEFPDRFFDVGIAEQHALGLAAGMAKEGVIPVVPIYSSFYQRGYDQVIHDIAAQNLPVVMCVDRAGVVGQDRSTTSRFT